MHLRHFPRYLDPFITRHSHNLLLLLLLLSSYLNLKHTDAQSTYLDSPLQYPSIFPSFLYLLWTLHPRTIIALPTYLPTFPFLSLISKKSKATNNKQTINNNRKHDGVGQEEVQRRLHGIHALDRRQGPRLLGREQDQLHRQR